MKKFGKVLRKLVELTPVLAVVIVFCLSSIVLQPAAHYVYLRLRIDRVETVAKANSYPISTGERVEDWGDGREEKHASLKKQLYELVDSSKVAKYCNDNGTPGFTPKVDIPLIIIGLVWILSILWIVITIIAKIRHEMRMYNERKQAEDEKRRNSIEERKRKAKAEQSWDSLRVAIMTEKLFGKGRSTNN